MTAEQEYIAQLLIKQIASTLSEQEQEELHRWLEESEDHRLILQWMSDPQHLEREYHLRKNANAEQAWQRFGEKLEVRGEKLEVRGERRILRYAAAILIFIIGGAAWWYRDYTRVTPPEIPEAVQIAMEMSMESGKMEAEVMDESGGWRVEGGERNASSAGNQQQDYSPSSLPTPPSSDISDLLSARRITTYHDKEYWVTLDDGTLVHLNYNTRLIYPEKFGRKNRTVILDGEAYFMVAKDKSRPFIVHTPNGDVKVYGTEFNVNTRTDIGGERKEERGGRNASSAGDRQDYSPSTLLPPPSSKTTTVILVNGSVSVTPTNGKEQLMKPGQQATFNAQSSTFNVQNVDVEPYVAWNTGTYVFEDDTVEKVMEVLSRWYGFHVTYGDAHVKDVRISGAFDRYLSQQQILDGIVRTTGLSLKVSGNNVVIQQQ